MNTTSTKPNQRVFYGKHNTSTGKGLASALDPFLRKSYGDKRGMGERAMMGHSQMDTPPVNKGSSYLTQKPVGYATWTSPGDQRKAGLSGRGINSLPIGPTEKPAMPAAGTRSQNVPASGHTWPAAVPQRTPMAAQQPTAKNAASGTISDYKTAIRRMAFNNQARGSVFAPRRRR